MGVDNRQLAMLGISVPFASGDAGAQLANTRTWLYGTDLLDSIKAPLTTWPGTLDTKAISVLKQAQGEDMGLPAGAQPQSGPTQGGATYDCATGKCSDGYEPTVSVVDK